MGFKKLTEKRIALITALLHYEKPVSTTKLAHETGLNYYVVKDLLLHLQTIGIAKIIDSKWVLVPNIPIKSDFDARSIV